MVTQMQDGTVMFRFLRPRACSVTLAGEFNDWNEASLVMNKNADGWWSYCLKLKPGCYRFRYLADGIWYTDYAAFGLDPGPFGMNSVIKVDPPQVTETEPEKPLVLKLRNVAKPLRQPLRKPANPLHKPAAQQHDEILVGVAG